MRLLAFILLLCTTAKAQTPQQLFWALQGQSEQPATFPVKNTSGLTAWYRADSNITTSGALVTRWDDLSGNLYHLAVSGFASPSVVTGGAGGKSLVRYSASTQNLLTGVVGAQFPDLSAVSVFVVGRRSSEQNGAFVGKWSANKGWMIYGNSFRFYTNGVFAATSTNTTATLISGIYDATTKQAYANGTNVYTTTGGTLTTGFLTASNTTFPLEVGKYGAASNTGLTDADIYEIIIYNRALSNTERQSIEAYLNGRYNLY